MFGSIDQAMENPLPETHKISPPSSLSRGFFLSLSLSLSFPACSFLLHTATNTGHPPDGEQFRVEGLCRALVLWGRGSGGLAYQGKDTVFRLIIEYSSLRDFGP